MVVWQLLVLMELKVVHGDDGGGGGGGVVIIIVVCFVVQFNA